MCWQKKQERIFGNHRSFNLDFVKSQFIEIDISLEPKVLIYTRVLSHDQKIALERQKDKLLNYCNLNLNLNNYNQVESVSDLGSGFF